MLFHVKYLYFRKEYALFLIFLLNVFYSCSKDDNPDSPEIPIESFQGVFVDSPIGGVKYETETHSGITDENGTFEYEEGETVKFYIGDIPLGSSLATEEISPLDIASTSDATIETQEVQNIAAFLQTLDKDGDPSNGIIIDEKVVEAISLSEIDFTQNIIQILGEIALEVFQNTGIVLEVVFPENAAEHLAQSLNLEFEPENLFMKNFVTIFSDYFGHNSKTGQWIHEFDEDGKLVKSSLYEKYPIRILKEFSFSNYQDGRVNFQSISYFYQKVSDPYVEDYTAFYNNEFIIQKFESLNTGYNPTPYSVLTELTPENFISMIENLDSEEALISSKKLAYNSENFLSKVSFYGPGDNLLSENEIMYTDFGDIQKEITNRPDGTYFLSNYFYRENNTLERIELEAKLSNSITYVSQEFDENEALLKDITFQEFDNGLTQKAIEYYDSGILMAYEWIYNGIKKQYSIYELDGNGGSYLSVIENYDENGNLSSKTCYNISGDEIECTD